MKRTLRYALMAALVLALVALAGCASEEEGEGMGVWGYVASADNAKLELSEDQTGAEELLVDRVVAPEDAWVVVHIDEGGMPGERIGLARVEKGETTDIRIELDMEVASVIVAVHADRGTAEEFDFDMENKEESPDRPFFVDEEELAKAVKLRDFGVEAGEGEAAIEVSDQPGLTDTLLVDRVLAPTGAFVVVHLDDDGMPGERVGYAFIPEGESTDVEVSIDAGVELTESLFIAVHADRGEDGVLEFDMEDKFNSPDQPFFVDGSEVATAARVK